MVVNNNARMIVMMMDGIFGVFLLPHVQAGQHQRVCAFIYYLTHLLSIIIAIIVALLFITIAFLFVVLHSLLS